MNYIRNDHTEEVKKELERRVETALEAIGIQAASLARVEIHKSPKRIDTGLLRNSITHALGGGAAAISSYKGDNPSRHSGKTPESGHYYGTMPKDKENQHCVYVGTNVKYAIYVHEGTDRMTPNRFIKNAVANNANELVNIAKRYISD